MNINKGKNSEIPTRKGTNRISVVTLLTAAAAAAVVGVVDDDDEDCK